jgi:hypothetical protein
MEIPDFKREEIVRKFKRSRDDIRRKLILRYPVTQNDLEFSETEKPAISAAIEKAIQGDEIQKRITECAHYSGVDLNQGDARHAIEAQCAVIMDLYLHAARAKEKTFTALNQEAHELLKRKASKEEQIEAVTRIDVAERILNAYTGQINIESLSRLSSTGLNERSSMSLLGKLIPNAADIYIESGGNEQHTLVHPMRGTAESNGHANNQLANILDYPREMTDTLNRGHRERMASKRSSPDAGLTLP